MSSVWDKLFKSGQPPANDTPGFPIFVDGVDTDQASAAAAGFAPRRPVKSGPRSQMLARTFNSIGRRNEALRAHLDAVEFSFRNIESIRALFHESLIPIDHTLSEIERTKIAHVEAERKLEALIEAQDRLKSDHAALTVERNGIFVKQDALGARVADLERNIGAAEAASSEARAALAERTAKLERVERELEDNRRRLQTVSDQLPALRGEFTAKEKRLQEVEQQRAALHDQNDLLTQESRALRTRIEDFVGAVSKLNRQLSELEGRREELNRRVDELETALAHETAAHAKLKATQLDAAEAARLAQTKLREDLAALNARFEAAEKLLSEARATLRERDASIRSYEQRALEHSLATKSKDAALADLEKDLTALRATHAEVDAARAAASDRSTGLAKALETSEIALQRAEQRTVTLEAKVAEQNRLIQSERELFEEKAGKLKDQLEAEAAARAFAEGALQSARQERGGRRLDGESPPASKEAPAGAGPDEMARDKVARLRG